MDSPESQKAEIEKIKEAVRESVKVRREFRISKAMKRDPRGLKEPLPQNRQPQNDEIPEPKTKNAEPSSTDAAASTIQTRSGLAFTEWATVEDAFEYTMVSPFPDKLRLEG
jgi:hypothetical protein